MILLDEVLAVGDEAFQRKCLGKMFERRRSGATIVFVSHDMGAVEMICDRAVLLEQGRLVADGIPADIIGQYHEDIAGHVEAPRAESAAIVVAEEDLASSAEIGETTPAARSWGTGRVRASGVRLTNEERVPTTRFLGGAQVQVEIDYEFADLDAPDPKFTVRVSELDGDVLFCVNTFIDEFDVQLQRPSGTVRLSIPDLPLMQGRFLLSIGLSTKEESEIFHLLERWVEFSVFSPRRQDGIIDVRRSWSTV